MIITGETNRTDPEGRALVPTRGRDPFRHKEVWAVYKFRGTSGAAESRDSGFLAMAAAKEMADNLNRELQNDHTYYFRVYRLAEP
jgi:hypothetical protein